MRVLVATGIFEPESGGPATYAPALARALVSAGDVVTVVTYSDAARYDADARYPFALVRVVRGNKLFNRIKYFFTLMRLVRECDVVYALDWFAAGLPVMIACRLFGKKYILRIGGDYVWEQHLQSGEEPCTLRDFYETGVYRRHEHTLTARIIRSVLRHAAHVVFNSDAQRDLYVRFLHLDPLRTSTVYNPVPRVDTSHIIRGTPTREIIYWGRLIVMKNVATLIRAFAQARLPADYTLAIIGDGPEKERLQTLIGELHLRERVHMSPSMSRDQVLERVKDARAFVLPSWTDIAPNQISEALAIGLPSVVTRENYLPIHDQLPEMIDPRSVDDIAAKLTMLADDARYESFATAFRSIVYDHDWQAVVREHRQLFDEVIGGKSLQKVRVLQIGADRSPRGILYPESPAVKRQVAYGEHLGALDIIGFSRTDDGRVAFEASSRVYIYPTHSLSPVFYGLDTWRIMRRLFKPQVISTQDPFETGLLGLLIARMIGVPLHVQVHTDVCSSEYARHSWSNRLRAMIAPFVLHRAARVRVVSERIKRSMIDELHITAPITVLPIYTDVSRFQAAQVDPVLVERFAPYRHKLLVVARLEQEKGVDLAIRAFAQSAGREDCLIVVGAGSEYGALERLARELGISDRVFWEGERDPAPYYAIASLVLVPSRYEGYGLVIVEALAAGKPVLATDVGVAHEAGAIVADVEHYVDALAQWITNGPHTALLRLADPYRDLDDYARQYTGDIAACTSQTALHHTRKTQSDAL